MSVLHFVKGLNTCSSMTIASQIAFKNSLKQFCREAIEKRIETAKEAMQHAQESANGEQKSSAGDKYETGRAMNHLQKDMHARQVTAYAKELAALYAVNTGTIYATVQPGCFFETDVGCFFIAAGLGKQNIQGKIVLFLSASAPLALAVNNKKKGDDFIFNGSRLVILALY